MCSPAELYILNPILPEDAPVPMTTQTVPSLLILNTFLQIWNISGTTVAVGVQVSTAVLVWVIVGVKVGVWVEVEVLMGVVVAVRVADAVGVFVKV
jgi:hypothetical protein